MKQDNLIKNLKENEYILIKSKDDLTFEHNKNTPLYKMTGFQALQGKQYLIQQVKLYSLLTQDIINRQIAKLGEEMLMS